LKKILKYTINILLVILFLFSLYKLYNDFIKNQNNINNILDAKKRIYKLNINSKLIYNLQKERGLTSIYYTNTDSKFLDKLNKQKAITDEIINSALQYNDIKVLKKTRSNTYEKMKNNIYRSEDIFKIATNVISKLSINSQEIILNTNNHLLKNSLIIQNDLNIIQ